MTSLTSLGRSGQKIFASASKRLISELSREATIIISSHNLDYIERLCEKVAVIRGGKVLVEDYLKKLRQAKNQVSIEIEQETPGLEEKLRKLPNVENISVEGRHITVIFKDKKPKLEKVTAILKKNRCKVISIYQGNSLEDFIVDITKQTELL